MTDMESYLDKVSGTLEDIIKRLECLESEIDILTADKVQIEAELRVVKPKLGLPVQWLMFSI